MELGLTTLDQTESYTYDALGNRLTRTLGGTTDFYLYDAANQLEAIRAASVTGTVLSSFGYDPNGNLETKTTTQGTLSLTYDAWDQLTQASKTWAHPETYAYDDLGRRITKTVNGVEQQYLYDGLAIAAEFGSSWTTATARYVHGPGIDTPIIWVDSAGTPSYYHQDGLGSVTAVTDQNSQAQGTARYDAWGNVTRQTGGLPQYGYTGREPDGTGLIYARARYYDPAVGRFTQRDPIGLAGGTNLYAYAGGNPTNFTDPLGTSPLSPGATLVSTAGENYFNTSPSSSTTLGGTVEVEVQRTVPFPVFGGGFEGGPKVQQSAFFDFNQQTVAFDRPFQFATNPLEFPATLLGGPQQGDAISLFSQGSFLNPTGAAASFDFAAQNAKTFNLFTPAIDTRVNMQISITGNQLRISGTLSGDDFPSAVITAIDALGSRRVIGQFDTSRSGDFFDGPVSLFPDDGQFFEFDSSVPLTSSGTFAQ